MSDFSSRARAQAMKIALDRVASELSHLSEFELKAVMRLVELHRAGERGANVRVQWKTEDGKVNFGVSIRRADLSIEAIT